MSGTKAQQARGIMAGVRPARAEQRKPPGASGRRALTYLDVAWRAEHRGKPAKAPNARCAAVGEASEASQGANVTVAGRTAVNGGHRCIVISGLTPTKGAFL